ncbi:MAG: hypothetical protein OXI81_14850 [Paracoccaceae bacterium]|nr:hypothetical protein [Paracoccaceae bacterium]
MRHGFQPSTLGSLAPVASCGLPLDLRCRRLWRLGCQEAGRWLAIEIVALTGAASVFSVQPGSDVIAVCALNFGATVWVAWWRFARSRLTADVGGPAAQLGRRPAAGVSGGVSLLVRSPRRGCGP